MLLIQVRTFTCGFMEFYRLVLRVLRDGLSGEYSQVLGEPLGPHLRNLMKVRPAGYLRAGPQNGLA